MSTLQHAGRNQVALSATAPPPGQERESQAVRVLDADERLGRGLDGDRLSRARASLTGRLLALDTGVWDVASLRGVTRMSTGLLVVEGFLARELHIESRASVELLGPGDLLRPWDEDEPLLPIQATWNVLSPVRAVVLGAGFTARVCEYPEVAIALLSRVHGRAQRLAESQAIAHATVVKDRVRSMLWHLADRWGRVTSDGVLVPLAVSHRMLAELVGARRPTVTVALAELARGGVVIRRDDGTWLLAGNAPPKREEAPTRRIPLRRRFVQPQAPPNVTRFRGAGG